MISGRQCRAFVDLMRAYPDYKHTSQTVTVGIMSATKPVDLNAIMEFSWGTRTCMSLEVHGKNIRSIGFFQDLFDRLVDAPDGITIPEFQEILKELGICDATETLGQEAA